MPDLRLRNEPIVGVYSVPIYDIPKWKSFGANTLFRWEEQLDTSKKPTVPKQTYEERAEEMGMMFVTQPTLDDDAILKAESKQRNRIGFMLPYDEPDLDNHNIPVSRITADISKIRKVCGPDLPIFLNFTGEKVTIANPSRLASYYGAIFKGGLNCSGSDWYPYNRDATRYPRWYPTLSADILLATSGGVQQFQILECCDQHTFELGRSPTPAEYAFSFWNCVAWGYKPINFVFGIGKSRGGKGFRYDNVTDEMKAVMSSCASQYKELYPIMNNAYSTGRRVIVKNTKDKEGDVVGVDYINDKGGIMVSFRFNWNRHVEQGSYAALSYRVSKTQFGLPSSLEGMVDISIRVPGLGVAGSIKTNVQLRPA